MPSFRSTLHAATGLAALTIALPAAAQTADLPPLPDLAPIGQTATTTPTTTTVKAPMSDADIARLPAEYRSLPVGEQIATTSIGADGVETITRTRRIASRAPIPATAYRAQSSQIVPSQPAQYYAPAYPAATYAPMVLDRESWIAECERRTEGRDKNSTGTIIGGLLGAIGGGILGNRVWDSERLAGTLIGGGVGGIAGALIGSLFNGDKKDDLYDCESALSTYLDQYGQYGAPRLASRVITAPAPAPVAYQGYPSYGYGYAQPTYYQPAQTMVMVPVTTYQPQRVLVRETTREETYEVPGAARTVPAPPPSPKMIKTAPVRVLAPVRAPLPSPKMIKN